LPEDAVVALGWFAAVEVDDFGGRGETFAGDFDSIVGSGEDSG
jgi:hypothetical protein